jgi:hypothetical protein
MSATSLDQGLARAITSRRVSMSASLDGLNAVTPVTLRPLTRCADQGRGSAVRQ